MKTMFTRVALGAAAALWLGGAAFAQSQNMGEITVEGTRAVTTKLAGKTSSGIPIRDVSLSYSVLIKGLDLASHADFVEAERRVKEVAEAACKELATRYPSGTPSEAQCAKAAADKAMVVVNGWAALASKAAGK